MVLGLPQGPPRSSFLTYKKEAFFKIRRVGTSHLFAAPQSMLSGFFHLSIDKQEFLNANVRTTSHYHRSWRKPYPQ